MESPLQNSLPEQRFNTCRWARPASPEGPGYCTHAEVLPFAGRNGFVPDAWCTECAFYKVKRKARFTER